MTSDSNRPLELRRAVGDVDGSSVPRAVQIPDDLFEAQAMMLARGWGDGLPLIPPTPELVQRFVTAAARPADEIVGVVEPLCGLATIEKIAVNAAMAGCLPAYMPVVLAAIEAILDPAFNHHGVNVTGHNCAPLVLVSGPVVDQLDINAGLGLFGPGWRANATIGRAVRLCMVNLGGARPGVDRSVHGHPGKYTYCIGEAVSSGRWPTLREDLGYDVGTSIVAVLAAEAPRSVLALPEAGGSALLDVVADTMTSLGSNNTYFACSEVLVVLGPTHTQALLDEGWTKEAVRRHLYESSRTRAGRLHATGLFAQRKFAYPPDIDPQDPEGLLPIVAKPEDIWLTTTTDGHQLSSVVLTWGQANSTVRQVQHGITPG